MSAKTKHNKTYRALLAVAIVAGIIDFALLIAFFLSGQNIAILNPKGLIAQEQLALLQLTVIILFVIAIPALGSLFFIAWKYRESNSKSNHDLNAKTSKKVVFAMWAVPTSFILVLASIMWPATHRLVPQDTIASDKQPLTIQVVSMNWKWLFLYPEQNIATVNFVQIPVDRPITFEMTADESPMSSFWIPNLGGQLYTMTTHVNRLNLMAHEAGDYPGSSAEINGEGFAGMRFIARASSEADFEQWVASVQQGDSELDVVGYDQMLVPSENEPVALYASYETNLFDRVIAKYWGSHGGHAH